MGEAAGNFNIVDQYMEEIGYEPLLNPIEERELAQAIELGRDAWNRLMANEDAVDEPVVLSNGVVAFSYAKEQKNCLIAHHSESRDVGILDKSSSRAHYEQLFMEGLKARERFITSNLRLVVSMAKNYPKHRGLGLEDLIQEGNIGLEHAVDKYDWRKGFKFSTYAVFWIRQSMGRALDNYGSLIRLPSGPAGRLRAAIRRVNGYEDGLDEENARLYRLSTHSSLNAPLGEEYDTELGDVLASAQKGPEEQIIDNADIDLLKRLLDCLEPKYRYLIEQSRGLGGIAPRTLTDIGREWGVTGEAVRTMEKRAMAKLREEAARLGNKDGGLEVGQQRSAPV